MNQLIKNRFLESIAVKNKIANDDKMCRTIEDICTAIITAYRNNGKVILCGNGGSASDALHIAGELMGRFQMERIPLPAVVLNADVATMTAIANDYGYDKVFSRQIKGHMTDKDVLIGFSTSGNSENIYNAVLKAKKIGGKTVGMLGNGGGKIKDITDFAIIVPSNVTARIQESHITTGHIICEIVEKAMA